MAVEKDRDRRLHSMGDARLEIDDAAVLTVRTAEAHVRLLESVNVENGQRFIAWSTDAPKVEEVCASIDRLLQFIHVFYFYFDL